MTSPKLVYFDTDPGVDDAVALAYLCATPAVKLVGIGSIFGNTSSSQAAQNALNWIEIMGQPNIPVAMGAEHPSHGEFHGGTTWIHGELGTGAIELPQAKAQLDPRSAAELLVDLANEYAGELEIITVGPLTNIAQALDIDPELPSKIKHVTIMGGATMHPGNISPVTEANIGKDAEASAIVFNAPWPITMVGLDATMVNNFYDSHRERLYSSGSKSAKGIADVLDFYFNFHLEIFGERRSATHDPLAAAIGAGDIVPELAPVVNVVVDDSNGPGRGQTICDLRGMYVDYPDQDGAHCAVVLKVPADSPERIIDMITTLP
ncbi:nucleoside hydrolase [Arcanobacterium ihumii]|uniref:nucleoside hydrolase n=1 Tax=Arcanobacterium ihumii TaxID=2138162 RepID=UPI000F524889|nr:nucleoside hydrolase [Arcanobacterium ihumii]